MLQASLKIAGIIAMMLSLAVSAGAQEPERLNLPELGRLPAFSHASLSDDLIFVSGTLGTRTGTIELVGGGTAEQTTRTLLNIELILEAAGATRRSIVKCNVYLKDMATFGDMNEAYIAFFGGDPPARTTVGVAELALGAAVEIEAIALRPAVADEIKERAIPKAPETGFFDTTDGERIYYEVSGEGPPIVLSHGLGGNHAIWYQQVADLAFNYQVVTWDQRGFGQSTNTGSKAGPKAFSRDLGELLDHLGLETAHLVGQSMGGWTVVGFAVEHPERVRSLTLADTIGGIYTPEIEKAFDVYIRGVLAGGEPENLGNHPALGRQLAQADLAQAFLYRQISGSGPAPPRAIAGSLRSTVVPHEKLKALTMPVLFIVGAHDPIFPVSSIRLAANLIEGSSIVEISGAGHSPYFEKAPLWNAAYRGFLRSSSNTHRE